MRPVSEPEKAPHPRGPNSNLLWSTSFDAKGDFYRTAMTSDLRSDDCLTCQAGKCMQRVIRYPHAESDVIVHDCLDEMS